MYRSGVSMVGSLVSVMFWTQVVSGQEIDGESSEIEQLQLENAELRTRLQYVEAQFDALVEFLICEEVIQSGPDLPGRVDWSRWSGNCGEWEERERDEEEWSQHVPELMRQYFATEPREEPWATETEEYLRALLFATSDLLDEREHGPMVRQWVERCASSLSVEVEGSEFECRRSACVFEMSSDSSLQCVMDVLSFQDLPIFGRSSHWGSEVGEGGLLWLRRQGFEYPDRQTLEDLLETLR